MPSLEPVIQNSPAMPARAPYHGLLRRLPAGPIMAPLPLFAPLPPMGPPPAIPLQRVGPLMPNRPLQRSPSNMNVNDGGARRSRSHSRRNSHSRRSRNKTTKHKRR